MSTIEGTYSPNNARWCQLHLRHYMTKKTEKCIIILAHLK